MKILDYLQSKFNKVRIVRNEAQLKCPFHNDHYPGHLWVNLDTGVFYCFHASCHESGNFNQFLEKLNDEKFIGKVEFSETLKLSRKWTEETEILDDSILSAFSGKIPTFLLKEYPIGLLKNKEIGFDELNYRATFPIRNINNQLVGISGRAVFDHQYPRYKVYSGELKEIAPNYKVFKGDHLYNLNEIYKNSTSGDLEIIIVEGFKACLRMLQHGYENTVAIMGSDITDKQVNLLSSLSNNFVIFPDNDEGGLKSLERNANKLQKIGRVKIMLGEKPQPDRYTKPELDELYSKKIGYNQYLINRRNNTNE